MSAPLFTLTTTEVRGWNPKLARMAGEGAGRYDPAAVWFAVVAGVMRAAATNGRGISLVAVPEKLVTKIPHEALGVGFPAAAFQKLASARPGKWANFYATHVDVSGEILPVIDISKVRAVDELARLYRDPVDQGACTEVTLSAEYLHRLAEALSGGETGAYVTLRIPNVEGRPIYVEGQTQKNWGLLMPCS